MASQAYTVLVTGSSGHLGAALVHTLPSYGHAPLGIDLLPSPTTHLTVSITDRPGISSLLAANPTITHIVHAATLHKPHVDSHPKEAFVETNVTGTLVLLEEAAARLPRLRSFVFVSTTSTFGSALSPAPGSPAAWIDETVTSPLPKNIYGVTKCAAEDLCRLLHVQTAIPVVVLRASRFFPEADDDEGRRVDISDVVSAVVCGMSRASALGFGRYVVSAPPPFPRDPETLARLDSDAASVFRERVPGAAAVFEKLGWGFLPRVDRVYDSSKAVRELGWRPEWTFEKVVERLGRGEDWRSELTHVVGKKGYHAVPTGVYTT